MNELRSTFNLTEKQLRFCEEYCVDFNGTQAAIRAGYSEKSAGDIACENLKKPDVQGYLMALTDATTTDLQAKTREIIGNLEDIMRGESVKTVYYTDKKGRHRARQEVPTINERLKAIDLLMKHYGMYNDAPAASAGVGPILIDICGEENLTDGLTKFN